MKFISVIFAYENEFQETGQIIKIEENKYYNLHTLYRYTIAMIK